MALWHRGQSDPVDNRSTQFLYLCGTLEGNVGKACRKTELSENIMPQLKRNSPRGLKIFFPVVCCINFSSDAQPSTIHSFLLSRKVFCLALAGLLAHCLPRSCFSGEAAETCGRTPRKQGLAETVIG